MPEKPEHPEHPEKPEKPEKPEHPLDKPTGKPIDTPGGAEPKK
jgi:hypothetical protein